MSDLPMSPQVFAIMSALVEDHLGLFYDPEDSSLLASKISARALECGFDALLDYYYFLRYDDPEGTELQALAEALVVHETFFFREYDQLDVTLKCFIAPEIEAGRRPRVWCAACSTGEEPYTVAMWLDQRGWLDRVELIASDISTSALATAQRRRYRSRSIRQVPSRVDPSPWLARDGEGWVVAERLQAAIHWQQLNLLDERAVEAQGVLDLILCRNVLIYFREPVLRRVVDTLSQRLKPDGVMLVGVSESLMRIGTKLTCEEHEGTFVYRKGSKP